MCVCVCVGVLAFMFFLAHTHRCVELILVAVSNQQKEVCFF